MKLTPEATAAFADAFAQAAAEADRRAIERITATLAEEQPWAGDNEGDDR